MFSIGQRKVQIEGVTFVLTGLTIIKITMRPDSEIWFVKRKQMLRLRFELHIDLHLSCVHVNVSANKV